MSVPRRTGTAIRVALLGATLVAPLGAACGGDDEPSVPEPACTVLWQTQVRLGSRIQADSPTAFRFGDYAIGFDGTITPPSADVCATDIAARLEQTCPTCERDPSSCELAVREVFSQTQPECHACGDERCSGPETSDTCPEDCAATCGNGTCERAESLLACPIDCATACGDRVCAEGETPGTCPADCNYTVGNGTCEPGESPELAPMDCQQGTCGDRYCQSYETTLLCPGDCCLPAACDRDGPLCLDADTIATCQVVGLGNCPELVDAQPCAYGCMREGLDYTCQPGDEACPAARCRTCRELAEAWAFDNGLMAPVFECTPGQVECGDPAAMVEGFVDCQAVPGFPDCGVGELQLCGSGQTCVAGACQ